jgi:isochorismate pyruvate lyase
LKAALRRVIACLDSEDQEMTRTPAQCRDMTELREQIDMLDAELVALMARRAACIDRAAEIKLACGLPARIEARVAEVIGNVRSLAVRDGFDPELAEQLWRMMIEWSIRREEGVLGPSVSPGAVAR